ncbi:MAG: rhodanese-like domain-containing protein [Smithella sp.]
MGTQNRWFLGLLVMTACLAMATVVQARDNYKGYVRGGVFITAAELNTIIQSKDPGLIIMAIADTKDYHLGHIPGAVKLWRPDYEANPESEGGVTDNIIPAEGFTKLMHKVGVNPDSKIVLYDHRYDATRVWWAFYYYGKTDVRVLDGGIKAWKDAGYPTDFLAPRKRAPGTWAAKITYPAMRVDTSDILALKDRKDAQLWDTRGDSEFCGKEIARGAHRAGRIPWAVQADYVLVKKTTNDAEWRTANEVLKTMKQLGFDPRKQHYFICQSGVRTTQWIITLYAMGWPMENLHNYDSSWIGWSLDKRLPVETGCPDTVPAPREKR